MDTNLRVRAGAGVTRASLEIENIAGSNGSLVLTGHSAAFAARTGVPGYLKGVDLSLNPLWRERLAALGTPAAESALTDLLGSKRSRALLGRARALAD